MRQKSTIMVIAAFLLLWSAGAVRADTLDAIRKTYREIQTVEAHFQQKIFIKALKRERDTEGDFFYKRSKGFLWKYTAPKEKIFLYDGAFIWQAEQDKPFVTREKVDRGHMEGNFLDLVDDVTRLDTLFTLKQSAREADMEVLVLVPKKEGTLQAARIWVDGRRIIRKMEITEITGNVNIIDFSQVRVNGPVADSLFVYKPKGKEIIDTRDGTMR
ncbi:MAG: outer membrane lipoprotein carrier protein LolA [Syntrophorhabdales bacterium]